MAKTPLRSGQAREARPAKRSLAADVTELDARAATVPLFLFGARGMLAGELLRLLELHPRLELAAAASREPEAAAQRHLSGRLRLVDSGSAEDELVRRLADAERAAVVLALPHGEAATTWPRLSAALGAAAERVHVVDLSADFRLRDAARYRAAYGHEHPSPDDLARFVYGLPELRRAELAATRRAAAAGCFATALQLAALPAAEAGILDASRPWILDGITGSSGSGNEPKPGTHHPHRHDNLWAYSVGGHRHEAELAQALEPLGMQPPLAFVAHSGPFARGIHLTGHLPLRSALAAADARELYRQRYAGEPFVEVLEQGTPDLRSVVGSNRVSIAVEARGELLHVLLTLDNLVKGGAGQGLQCLNLMLGFPETLGLPRTGLGVS